MAMMMMMTEKVANGNKRRHEGGGEGQKAVVCTSCVQAVCRSCVAAFEEIPTNARNWPTANSRTEDDEDGDARDKQFKKSMS